MKAAVPAHREGRTREAPATRRATRRFGTLHGQVGRRIGVAVLAIVLVATAGTYWLTLRHSEDRELANLVEYVSDKGRTESRLFREGQREVETLGGLFLEVYLQGPPNLSPAFDQLFQRGADGAWRTLPGLFDGAFVGEHLFRRVSGFIGGNRTSVDSDLQRRLVIALRLVAEMGLAVNSALILHATFPENAIVLHSDEAWGLSADAELDMPSLSVVRSTLQSENPARLPLWTRLYYDATAAAWAVTYQLPVDHAGRHLFTPSADLRLTELIARVLQPRAQGSVNMILGEEGSLIAHPDFPLREHQRAGQILLAELGDPELSAIHREIADSGPVRVGAVTLIEEPLTDSYLAATKLEGPGWWWVTQYPRALVAASARGPSRRVLALGVTVFLFVMVAVSALLRRRVAGPIGTLIQAAELIGHGDYAAIADGRLALPEDHDNEIGSLARTVRQMAKSLRQSREMDDALFLVDVDGRIHEANPAAARLTGRPLEDLVGAALPTLAASRDGEPLRRLLTALEPGQADRLTVRIRPHGSEDIQTELSVRAFATPHGDRRLVTARDITLRLRQEEERLRSERELLETQRVESLGRLAGGIAHEFNNAMLAVLGNAELARERLEPEDEVAAMLADISEAAQHASDLAEGMLAYSGRSHLELREVALHELCADAAELARPSIPPRVELRLELDPATPPVKVDPSQIRQVVTQLLINAWEALGGDPGTVVVGTHGRAYGAQELAEGPTAGEIRPGTYATLEVVDTGPGIDDDHLDLIFDPFFSTKFTGRGLGLAAVVGIVRSHHGAVLVSRGPEGGTRFRVLLPPSGATEAS